MKTPWYPGLVAGIVLVYCSLAGVSQSNQQEIPFRLVRDNVIVVSVQVNGRGPFDFVLDTGNDITTVDSSLADKLGLIRSGRMKQISVVGQNAVDKSTLDNLVLGVAHTEDFPVLVEDLGYFREAVPHIQGVLSQDFLSQFNYLLDYSKCILRIESETELRDSLAGQRVPLEGRNGNSQNKMIVIAEARALNHSTLRLVLDSGANDVVLMRDASKRLQVQVKGNRWERTATGTVAVYAGPVQMLSLGTEKLRDVMAVSTNQTALPFGDGLLPTSLFHSLYINNLENFVVFNPRVEGSSPRH
jgi:predicted aspartyl protease